MKKRLTVLALAFAMVLTMSATVFAAAPDGTNTNKSGGDASYLPGTAQLVKYVQVGEGITVPADKFTFNFERVASDDSTIGLDVPVGTGLGTFTYETDKAANAMDSAGVDGTQNKKWSKSIAEIFAAQTGNDAQKFPRAGEYTWNVSENNITSSAAGKWTKSSDSYKLRLIVNANHQITDVTVEKATPSSGDKGKKVDPTDVDPTNNGNPSSGDEPSPADSLKGFTFTNSYTVDVTKNPETTSSDGSTPTADGAFTLSKEVTGDYGDQTAPFTFTVNIALPKTGGTIGAASISEGEGSVDPLTEGDNTVTLKHGATMKIASLPAGTTITVKEDGVANYKTSAAGKETKVENGSASIADKSVAEGADAAGLAETKYLVGEKGAYTNVTNAFQDENVTPTGIIINNLPYVLLIGLALGGIVLFSRKRRYE